MEINLTFELDRRGLLRPARSGRAGLLSAIAELFGHGDNLSESNYLDADPAEQVLRDAETVRMTAESVSQSAVRKLRQASDADQARYRLALAEVDREIRAARRRRKRKSS